MTVRRIVIVCALPLIVAAVASAQTSGPDGVYNKEQATRGQKTYDAKCAGCHDGGAMGPELWGEAFLSQWENKSLSTFFSRIQTTMPEDAPGSLSENEVLDVVAYVLQTNGFPAGDKAIERASALDTIKLVRRK